MRRDRTRWVGACRRGDASRGGSSGVSAPSRDAPGAGSSDGEVRVWVHIADVSAYVPEGSLVDREARRRGTSVYAPGAVEPMLPEALSNDACSLVPGVERAAVTVEMDLRGAEVVRTAFYRSLIRSDVRLEYERVDRVFAGQERAEDPWAQPLAAAREASAALGRARERGGRAGDRLRGAGGGVRRGRARARDPYARADGVASTDRAPDDRRQRSGGAAPVRAGCAVPVSRARAPRARKGAAAGRAARVVGGGDAGGARHDLALAGGGADGRGESACRAACAGGAEAGGLRRRRRRRRRREGGIG